MRVDIAITHDNGMRTSHQYTVPNDNNVDLVCTNLSSNGRIVYPLVQVQSRPNPIMGQSGQIINPHFRRPGAGAVIRSEFMAKRLRDQTSGLVSEPNILISHNSSYFSVVPNSTPSCFDPSILLNSFNLSSNGNNAQLVKGSVSTEESGGRVVGSEKQNPKGGPYTCKRCGDVFDICQAFASHMNTHYRAEETPEERLARQAASKYKKKRANSDFKLESISSSNSIVPAAPDLCRENGENSNAKSGHDDYLWQEFLSPSMIVPEPTHRVMDTAAPDICKESGEQSSDNKDYDLE